MTELQNEIEELLGPSVQVNDEVIRACQERNEFGGLSFALFKEAAGTVWVTLTLPPETVALASRVLRYNWTSKEDSWLGRGTQRNRS